MSQRPLVPLPSISSRQSKALTMSRGHMQIPILDASHSQCGRSCIHRHQLAVGDMDDPHAVQDGSHSASIQVPAKWRPLPGQAGLGLADQRWRQLGAGESRRGEPMVPQRGRQLTVPLLTLPDPRPAPSSPPIAILDTFPRHLDQLRRGHARMLRPARHAVPAH